MVFQSNYINMKRKLKNSVLIVLCGCMVLFILAAFFFPPRLENTHISIKPTKLTFRDLRTQSLEGYSKSSTERSPHRMDSIPWHLQGENKRGSFINCSFSSKINIRTTEYAFQPLHERSMYVYSAFLDVRSASKRALRIVAISPTEAKSFYCQLFYPDGAVISVPASFTNLLQGRQRELLSSFRYMSQLLYCKEPIGIDPLALSVTHTPCLKEPTNALKVHVRGNVPEHIIPDKILTCVKLLYNYKAPHKLIEFMEYQKIVGVDHVNIFDLEEPTDDVIKVAGHYIETGMLTLQPWKLPMTSSLKLQDGGAIRVHGQHAQIQDCLYRNMHKYKYIAVLDTDEFIIPHKAGLMTHRDILRLLNQRKSQHSSSFAFANAHFCLSDREMVHDQPRLLLTTKLQRNPLAPFPDRSKSIINPRRVVMMGVHVVKEPYPGFKRFTPVPPSIAFMHHYRKTKVGKCATQDKTALRYENQLNSNVNKVCDMLNIPRTNK